MIKQISIENLYGVEKLEFNPGSVCTISGANGAGKSSVLESIASVFAGGIAPERLRIGAKEGYCKLTLDDGSLVQFRAWIKKKKDGTTEAAQVREYITREGISLPSEATLIRELGDALAVDPAKLLACDVTTAAGRKALTQAILDVLPFSVGADDLDATLRHVGDTASRQPYETEARAKAASVLPAPVDLGGLRKARQALEETRRRIGVEAKQASAAVAGLSGGIASEASPGDTHARLEQAEAALEAHRQVIRDEQALGRKNVATARLEAEQAYHARLTAIQTSEREWAEWVEDEYAAHETELATLVVGLKSDVAAVQRAEGARAQIVILENEAAAKGREYEVFSRAMEMLDEVKAAKLANSPIPELTVEGDDINVSGVPWQAVNTATRVRVVVQLCCMRAGKLRFLLLDDAEHLDAGTWAALKGALVEAGFQVVAAFVESGSPLTVRTVQA